MITMEKDRAHFHYRVAGLAIREDLVLLHSAEIDQFWALPGGRVNMLERADEALRREMYEELGLEPEVKRLLWVVENFFVYQGEQHHELGHYFLMEFPPESPLYQGSGPFFGKEDGWLEGGQKLVLTFRWFPRDSRVLAGLPLYPEFLQHALEELPDHPEHVVEYGEGFTRAGCRGKMK